MENNSEYILVATLGRAQGIKGEIKINLISGDREKFKTYKTVFVDGKEYGVTAFNARQNGDFVKLSGVGDRNAAEMLTNKTVSVLKSCVPMEEGEYFISDLIGAKVTAGGKALGTLKGILSNRAADVYSVAGEKPFMFPGIKKVFKRIDIDNGVIELDPDILNQIALYDGD